MNVLFQMRYNSLHNSKKQTSDSRKAETLLFTCSKAVRSTFCKNSVPSGFRTI